MRSYSQDLRQRIVDTVQRGEGTIRQIAERFLVSVAFVTRLLQLHRSSGSVEPRPHGGGNPAALTPEDLERLREFIQKRCADSSCDSDGKTLSARYLAATSGTRIKLGVR